MKRIVFLFLLGLATTFTAQAQDIIITKKSDRIEAKIIEVTETEVKFKSASNLDGSTITLPTSKISSILYANGEARSFENVQEQIHASSEPVCDIPTQYTLQKVLSGNDFELSINTLVSATWDEPRTAEGITNLGFGLRFGQRFYWGVNVGASRTTMSKSVPVHSGSIYENTTATKYEDVYRLEVGSTLRPTFPIAGGKANFFVDFYGGVGIDDDTTLVRFHIMPGLQYPLSGRVDFLVSAGYINSFFDVQSQPSFGMNASFAFHSDAENIHITKKPTRTRGLQLSVETKRGKFFNKSEYAGRYEDEQNATQYLSLVPSFKINRHWAIGVGISLMIAEHANSFNTASGTIPSVHAINAARFDIDGGDLAYFLRLHYRFADKTISPFAILDLGMQQGEVNSVYRDPWEDSYLGEACSIPYTSLAAGLSWRITGNAYLEARAGFDLAVGIDAVDYSNEYLRTYREVHLRGLLTSAWHFSLGYTYTFNRLSK